MRVCGLLSHDHLQIENIISLHINNPSLVFVFEWFYIYRVAHAMSNCYSFRKEPPTLVYLIYFPNDTVNKRVSFDIDSYIGF